jgi:hypothetical protein
MTDGQQLGAALKAWLDNVVIPVLVHQYRTEFHPGVDSVKLDDSESLFSTSQEGSG